MWSTTACPTICTFQILGDGEVQIVGQTVVNHVGLSLFHHLLVVGIEGSTFGNAGLQFFVQIAGGHQLDLGIAQDAVQMYEGNVAQADNRGFNHSKFSLFRPKPTAAYAAVGWFEFITSSVKN